MTGPGRLLERCRREEGASSVELLVFFPLLLLIILVTVQVSLSWYGNEVAISTARELAREIRDGTNVSQAQQGGTRYARSTGGSALTDVVVSVSLGGDQVTVEVTGKAMDIVAGLAPRVRATVTSQLETFREDR